MWAAAFTDAAVISINDPNFHELGNERDPIIGNQDGTLDMTIPKRPIRKKITGLPAFTTVKGGGRGPAQAHEWEILMRKVFLAALSALVLLAEPTVAMPINPAPIAPVISDGQIVR